MFRRKDGVAEVQDLLTDEKKSKKNKKKKRHIFRNILFCCLLVVSGVAGFLVAKAQVTFDDSMRRVTRDIDTSLSTVDLSNIKVKSEDDIVNLLIVGNDRRKEPTGMFGGLSDVVIIATMDQKHGCLKLTSLLRDTRVYCSDAGTYKKLTETMAYGGVKGLYKAIAENYNIKLDGYVEVGFKAFQDVVDSVGGVEIELTDTEVRYLEASNYIRKKQYRKGLKVGKQTLNGSQALGYCRIRKGTDLIGEPVVTANGLMDDYGRAWRQRTLLSAVFNKMKSKSMSTWLEVANKVLDNLKTDLSDKQILDYMKSVILIGTTEVQQQQIPMNGYFWANRKDEVYPTCYVIPTNGQDREWNMQPSMEALHQFIFEYDGKGEFEYKPQGADSKDSN